MGNCWEEGTGKRKLHGAKSELPSTIKRREQARESCMEQNQNCHPLLRGGSRKVLSNAYSHGFSSGQMQSLDAFCETLIPPLPAPSFSEEIPVDKQEAIRSFYKASGSQSPVPDEVAELMVKSGAPEAVLLVRLVLKFLSCRSGTLLLCGFICLDWKWPLIHKFSEISAERREEILRKWSRQQYLTPFRVVFGVIKLMCIISSKKGLQVMEDPEHNTCKVKCDVVIVGSGCGGGVAASALASSGKRVLVLDKGNYSVPEDYSSLEGPSMSELYESGGFLSAVDGETMLLAGSTVGGGAAVNWSACIKTADSVLREWSVDHMIPLYGSPEYQYAMDADAELRYSYWRRPIQKEMLGSYQGSREVKRDGHFRHHLDEIDKENLKIGLRKALRILIAAGAVKVGTYRSDGQRLVCEGISEKDLEEFLDTIRIPGGLRSREEN
ncbi:hypothetical protein Peur_012130 [Populus x canadensis]